MFVEDHQSAGQRVFDDFSTKMSFVQIRGSVPVFWAEVNTLRYKPDLQVMDLPDTVRASSIDYLILIAQMLARLKRCACIFKNKYLFMENRVLLI